MRIVVIGGGPAGLYFSILMKQQDRRHEITVFERNRPSTRSAGASSSPTGRSSNSGRRRPRDPGRDRALARALGRHRRPHPGPGDHVRPAMASPASSAGICSTSSSVAPNAWASGSCSRPRSRRLAAFPDADLIVAADGINSRVRSRSRRAFPARDRATATAVTSGSARRGRSRPSPSSSRRPSRAGSRPMPTASTPPPRPSSSRPRRRSGGAPGSTGWPRTRASPSASALFAPILDGHPLLANARAAGNGGSGSISPASPIGRWVKDNLVLMGDAAHSAHFSIGSGTKLALEDAIALARCLGEAGERPLPDALQAYEAERKVEVLKLQSAARNSTEWFENVERYVQAAARAVRLQPAHPQPAGQPREPAPARPGLARGLRALVRRAARARRPGKRCRRCSRPFACAT